MRAIKTTVYVSADSVTIVTSLIGSNLQHTRTFREGVCLSTFIRIGLFSNCLYRTRNGVITR